MKGVSHVIIGLAGGAAVVGPSLAATVRPLLTGTWPPTPTQLAAFVQLAPLGAACIVGALLPDIDHPHATIRGWLGLASHQTAWEVATRWGRALGGRRVGLILAALLWLPVALYRLLVKTALDVTLEHRGPTHTLWALGAVWWLGQWCPWPALGLALALGYGLHIAADMLTRSGVALLWPLTRHAFGLLPKFLRFQTGSWWEGLTVLGVVTSVAGYIAWAL